MAEGRSDKNDETRTTVSSIVPVRPTHHIREQARRLAMQDTAEDQGTVLWETSTHRLRLVDDPIPSMPENMGGCPVFYIQHRGHAHWEELEVTAELVHGTGTLHLEPSESSLYEHLEEIRSVLLDQLRQEGARTSPGQPMLSSFTEWIEREHEGSIAIYGPNQFAEGIYVAINTRTLRDYWIGDADPALLDHEELSRADLDEIQAWLEGEVYGLVLEQRFDVTETSVSRDARTQSVSVDVREYVRWDLIEARYGFYGADSYQCEADGLAAIYPEKAATAAVPA